MSTDNTKKPDEVLSKEDLQKIDKAANIIESAIDKFTDNGEDLPYKSGDLRVLKELAEALAGTIINKAKLKQQIKKDNEDTDDNLRRTAILEAVAKKRKALAEQDVEVPDELVIDTLPDNLMPTDIVPGETDIVSAPLETDDFTKTTGDD
jgi:predicted oxidoreductase